MTALTQAILLENTSLQKLLEERGAKIDQKGMDAILRASIHQKKVSLMKRFLTHDVDLDSKHEGCTTIECLCEEILHYFVSRGVDLNQLYHDGHTHLTYAIHWGDLPLVQMLLRAGANPNAKDREEKTPLAIARDEHRDEIIQCLEGFGAQDVVV